MVTLGAVPIPLTVHLSRGSDFSCVLHSNSGDWPDSAEITLEVGTETWTAELAGPDATFTVDQDDVDTAIAAGPRHVRLWYTDGELRLLWGYANAVTVHG